MHMHNIVPRRFELQAVGNPKLELSIEGIVIKDGRETPYGVTKPKS